MRKFLILFLFILITNQILKAQQINNNNNTDVSVTFKSPRDVKIIDILMQRNDVYRFCDNFYSFYYTTIPNEENIYYIVEKERIRDSINFYNAMYIKAIDLKLELIDTQRAKKVFIVPLY